MSEEAGAEGVEGAGKGVAQAAEEGYRGAARVQEEARQPCAGMGVGEHGAVREEQGGVCAQPLARGGMVVGAYVDGRYQSANSLPLQVA